MLSLHNCQLQADKLNMAEQFQYDPKEVCKVLYTNWKGETAVRRIVPRGIRFGSTEYHKEPQQLLDVWDVEKNAPRTYAMKDIHAWVPDTEEIPRRIVGYMDLVDFDYELGNAAGGNSVYPSIYDCERCRPCTSECGIAEVAVVFQKVAKEGKRR